MAMEQWLEDFKQTIDSAFPRLLRISEAQSEAPRAEEHWSSKQIIGHLIDSAANNHARFVLAQFKDDLVFPGYDQNKWVQAQQYEAASWPQLVELMARVQSAPAARDVVRPKGKAESGAHRTQLANHCFQD